MRSGSFATTWCVRIGKYCSNCRPLTVMIPVPGRRRTRAMAFLRRPVVWMRGLGTQAVLLIKCSRSGARAGEGARRERAHLRLLRRVRMRRTRMDLELLQHLPPERTLGQHPPHGEAHHPFGIAREQGLEVLGLDAAGVAGVAVVELVVTL